MRDGSHGGDSEDSSESRINVPTDAGWHLVHKDNQENDKKAVEEMGS